MVFVELGDGGFERELAARDLELLDEIGGAGEQHAPAVLDQGEADGRGEMAFAAARRAEQDQVGALLEPAVARAQSAMTWALARPSARHRRRSCRGVLPGGRRASARCRSMRRRSRSAISCSARAARKRAAGHPSLSARAAKSGQACLMAGRRRSLQDEGQALCVDRLGGGHAAVHAASPHQQGVVGGERHQDRRRPRADARGSGAKRARKAARSGRRPSARSAVEACRPARPRRRARAPARAARPSCGRRRVRPAARAGARSIAGRPRAGTAGRGRPRLSSAIGLRRSAWITCR